MKERRASLACEMEILGVLARQVPTRLLEISVSGCLLESGHRIEEGTVGALRLEVQGREYSDDVRATRCVAIEGSGSRYLVGVEFLRTGRSDDTSIRRAMASALNGHAPGSLAL
jgi:PilZ domain